ncbi:UBC-like protein [Mycena indigotica]|uniref:UBC-like protein n=1 Tax=Mycena indigotica TaxID=2126181 RepID=A0A8H6SN23_9AGAR|nr:UBC-like protein [Mycena indigotica]KAF7301661.1 UBC-like protein [Mycena indigotica]
MLVNLVTPIDFTSKSNKPAQRKSTVSASSDSVDPVTRTTISLEFASLGHRDHCPLGIYILPSPDTITVWDGVFFVHQGYFADAVFKFRLTFPSTYPENPPPSQILFGRIPPACVAQLRHL